MPSTAPGGLSAPRLLAPGLYRAALGRGEPPGARPSPGGGAAGSGVGEGLRAAAHPPLLRPPPVHGAGLGGGVCAELPGSRPLPLNAAAAGLLRESRTSGLRARRAGGDHRAQHSPAQLSTAQHAPCPGQVSAALRREEGGMLGRWK